jgi:HK97 family phage prohead protease
MNKELERRFTVAEFRMFEAADGQPPRIIGYAARYNKLSESLGKFREQIAPTFFNGIEGNDVRALFNHDPNYVLGRSTSGTAKLQNTIDGLAVDITPPDTQWARDLMTSIKRGDITQMSFAFSVAKGGDKWEKVGEDYIRTLTQIDKLYDVSVVTYPAYPETSAAVRSMIEALEKPSDEILEAASRDAEQALRMNEMIQRRRLQVTEKKFN